MLDVAYQGIQEVPMDLDITLPDYCPDIGKILKCQISAGVTSRNISGDLLSFEGVSTLELIYSDLERNTIRCFKTDVPFSRSVNVSNIPQLAVATFDIKKEYVNCRAVSARRIDVHGAFSVKIHVFGMKDFEITNDISSEDVQQKKSDVSFSQLNSLLQHQISINEVLDLGSDKNAPEFIIKSNVNIIDLEYSINDEKINIKGKINVTILYVNDIETGKTEFFEYDIPINELVEASGVMEDNNLMVIPEIIFHNEKVSSDSESLSNLINEEVKIMLTIFVFQDDETKIIKDAYSTDYETELCYESFSFKKFLGTIDETITHKEIINNNEFKFFKILDVWTGHSSANIFEKDSNSGIEGKINLCILALDPDFVPFYFEREIKFSKDFYNFNDYKSSDTYIFVSVQSIDYKIINNNSIEIKLNIQININELQELKHNLISNMTSSDSVERVKDSNTAMTIYYANVGETLWDIAKNYGTTVEKIQDENDIDFEILESDRAILIPTV